MVCIAHKTYVIVQIHNRCLVCPLIHSIEIFTHYSYGCLPTKGIVAVCPIVMIDLTDTGKNKKKNLS